MPKCTNTCTIRLVIKQIIWRGSSRRRIQDFPSEAQDIGGYELLKVQFGKPPSDWKPVPSVGSGAIEIRIHHPHEHRIMYVANYPEAIYILHCFEKKTPQTSLKDIELARKEYAELQKYRQKQIRQEKK